MQLSKFWQNVGKVAGRSVVAQLLTIISLPILSRVYKPDDFGVLALFLAVSGIISTVACGRFEVAIPLPIQDDDAWDILLLCLICSSTVAVIIFFFLGLFPKAIFDSYIQFLIPIEVFCVSVSTALAYWLTRQGQFTAFAIAGVSQSIITVICQFMFGFFGTYSNGLIYGHLVGVSGSLIIMASYIYFRVRLPFGCPSLFYRLKKIIRLYYKNPIYLIPAHFVNSFAANYPTMFFTQYYGTSITGLYHLSTKIVIAPASLIGSSISQVFYPEASRLYAANQECSDIFRRMVKILSIVMIPVSAAVAIGGFFLASFILGSNWEGIGLMIAILAIGNCVRFINAPVSGLWMISGNQRLDLVWQLFMFSLITLGLHVGYGFGIAWWASLTSYAAAITIAFGINLLFCMMLSQGRFGKNRPVTE